MRAWPARSANAQPQVGGEARVTSVRQECIRLALVPGGMLQKHAVPDGDNPLRDCLAACLLTCLTLAEGSLGSREVTGIGLGAGQGQHGLNRARPQPRLLQPLPQVPGRRNENRKLAPVRNRQAALAKGEVAGWDIADQCRIVGDLPVPLPKHPDTAPGGP